MSARIEPGGRHEIGTVNLVIARVLGLVSGGPPPNVFTTLARHRSLFRRWLWFAGALMPGGRLPRADTELVILRVAENCGCEYERRQHERLARLAGLTDEQLGAVRLGPEAELWTPRQRLLLRAVEELHADRTVSEVLWPQLRAQLDERELIELCLLVGHYEMVAMALNALAVTPDELPDRPPAAAKLVQRLLRQRPTAIEPR